jgi:hypothetical protein
MLLLIAELLPLPMNYLFIRIISLLHFFYLTMKLLFLSVFVIVMFGCSNNPTTVSVQEQVVSPKTLTFMHGDAAKTLSITHTCTCPFPWSVNVLTATQVLKDTSGYGDNTKVPISIDRSKITVDTLHAMLQVKSSYGADTVQVTVIR